MNLTAQPLKRVSFPSIKISSKFNRIRHVVCFTNQMLMQEVRQFLGYILNPFFRNFLVASQGGG